MFLKQRLLSSPFEKKDEMIVFVDNKRIEMEFKIRGWKVYIYIYIYTVVHITKRKKGCSFVDSKSNNVFHDSNPYSIFNSWS